jgi:hypothetical protein
MAVSKTILQNVRQQTILKFIGDGTMTANLLELKLADETFLGEPLCNVNIQTVMWSATDSISAPILIQRGGANVMVLHGADSWELDQGAGFHDQTSNTSNVTVVLPAGPSMLYLVLGKSAGYQEPDQQTKR